jgi:small nuclear ribonucleoprotein D3
MNVQLKNITVTARDGRVAHLEQVYIRGSHVRYFVVPDMLRYDTLRYLHGKVRKLC